MKKCGRKAQYDRVASDENIYEPQMSFNELIPMLLFVWGNGICVGLLIAGLIGW